MPWRPYFESMQLKIVHTTRTHMVCYMECIEMVLPYIWLASPTSFECELANNGSVDFALANVMNTTFIYKVCVSGPAKVGSSNAKGE